MSFSDIAFYSQARFKPYVDIYLEDLERVRKCIVGYWSKKEKEEGSEFSELDWEDSVWLSLT